MCCNCKCTTEEEPERCCHLSMPHYHSPNEPPVKPVDRLTALKDAYVKAELAGANLNFRHLVNIIEILQEQNHDH